ncbi:MAG: protein kinase [Gemmatimonadetes bacterium]|nr:protein kinase [Gemmatimonadota bacterium]
MSPSVVDRLNEALEGQYRVEREIGRGGMAVVYLAEDVKHHRPVAIKVLDTDVAEAVGEERFAREIETAARLNHPNILALHDSGEADGLRYFVMPYIDGESLRDVLEREGHLDQDRAIGHAREIASALSYAHGQGLVHRDIKPENILLQAGHAVVCDFGIAKAMSEANLDTLTRTGTSVGTFAYMSPEQLSEDLPVDARSDVYALGCVVHEMLEGHTPFKAATPQATMAKKLVGDLPATASNPNVPHSVWSVLRRALEVDADERYSTADEFMQELTAATTDHAVARGRRRRRIGQLGRTVGAAVVAGLLVATGMWLSGRVGGVTYERLAVMPLGNGSGDSREDFYVRGVFEDLVEEMQRAGLRVLNPSATRVLAGRGLSPAEIAVELGVDALVEGSVERIGPNLGVDVSLVDGATMEPIWTESFSGAQDDVLTLLHRITLEIADQTGAELSPDTRAALAEATDVDPILYELLLQGRYAAFQITRESLEASDRFFERAIARDSMSAEGWIGLAGNWGLRAQEGFISGDAARAKRDSVLELAPIQDVDQRTLALEATWWDWPDARWGDAERAFLTRLDERPNDELTRAYFAQLLLYLGRREEAERETVRAANSAPYDPTVLGLHGQSLNALHRYEEAESVLTFARDLPGAPSFVVSTLRATYHLLGQDSLAIESTRDFYRGRGDTVALAALDAGYERGGYPEALRAAADVLVERRNAGQDVSEWQIGTLYTRAGMHDEAIRYLGHAMDEGSTNSPSLAIDPIFDPMRDDPRFQELVARLGLPGAPGPG